jgi:LuxR family quorum-sensing transcriptional regulator LasR
MKLTDAIVTSDLLSDALKLNECQSSQEVNSALAGLVRQLGFDGFLYGGRFSIDCSVEVEHIESNYKQGWREYYMAQEFAQIDPTVLHAVTSLRPLVWADEIYSTDAQLEFKEDAASHGLAYGATFPIHSKGGDVALLSLALNHSGPDSRRHVQERLVWGPLIANMAHDAMCRIIKEGRASKRPILTKRELEVLKWIGAGKSTWEISRLINISEHGVVFHVRNLLLKFDVASRHQAVIKAIALDLI